MGGVSSLSAPCRFVPKFESVHTQPLIESYLICTLPQTNSMKLLRIWSFEFGGRSNYCDIIWLHRFLYCAVRTSCCFSRSWSGRRNHPVWQVYVIDDQQTWTSGQKAMSHIAKTSQQLTYNFQWIHFFSKPRRLSGNFLKLYTTMALRARSRRYWKLNFSPRCPAFQNWARK